MNDEIIYQVTGYQYGMFKNNDGDEIPYCSLFCISSIDGAESSNFHFAGHRAEKFGCVSPDVLEGVAPRDKVHLYFNKRGRVVLIENVNEK